MSIFTTKLAELEARIEQMEKGIQALKQEATELRNLVGDSANPIFGLSIEEMGLSSYITEVLKEEGVVSIAEVILLSKEELSKIFDYENDVELVLKKVKEFKENPSKALADIKAKKDEEEFCLKMTEKLINILERYGAMKEAAKQNGINFVKLGRYGGLINGLYSSRLYRMKKGVKKYHHGSLGVSFYKKHISDDQSVLFELLNAEETSLKMLKTAVINDFTQSTAKLDKSSDVYQDYLRFCDFVNHYEE